MYPSTTLFIAIGQFAIVILVMFSYPLQVHPCRNCLDKVFSASSKALMSAADQTDEGELDGHGHAASDMSGVKHILITGGVVTCGFAVAYFVNDLQMGEHRDTP